MFIDEAEIEVISGAGGSGCMSFHREKHVPKGGPDGGDGGKGGNVIMVGERELHTLMDTRYKRMYKAQRGKHGMGAKKYGKGGADEIIKVPLGTIVRNRETGEVVCEFVENGQSVVIAKGGKGGRGNVHFKSATNRAPRNWEAGQEGQQFKLKLELKLLADIGLVGFPNAGKSTLISAISSARPKIANYPFTTLIPNLGIVKYSDYGTFVVADIPGLIEGAHTGKGLGHQFLKHVERTNGLLFLIDIAEEKPKETYRVLYNELAKYNPDILERPRLILITKIDTDPDAKIPRSIDKTPVMAISSVARMGLDGLIAKCVEMLKSDPE
ncbi:GTPase ObgE [candidate division KSB1 bacterium]